MPSKTRVRVVYRDASPESAAQTPHPTPSITWGNIIGWFASPAVFGAVFLIGQWALLGDSTKRSAEDIKTEKVEREKMRESFMASQSQLVSVLGRLDSRMSVSEKTTDTMSRQLEKLTDVLNQSPRGQHR